MQGDRYAANQRGNCGGGGGGGVCDYIQGDCLGLYFTEARLYSLYSMNNPIIRPIALMNTISLVLIREINENSQKHRKHGDATTWSILNGFMSQPLRPPAAHRIPPSLTCSSLLANITFTGFYREQERETKRQRTIVNLREKSQSAWASSPSVWKCRKLLRVRKGKPVTYLRIASAGWLSCSAADLGTFGDCAWSPSSD